MVVVIHTIKSPRKDARRWFQLESGGYLNFLMNMSDIVSTQTAFSKYGFLALLTCGIDQVDGVWIALSIVPLPNGTVSEIVLPNRNAVYVNQGAGQFELRMP